MSSKSKELLNAPAPSNNKLTNQKIKIADKDFADFLEPYLASANKKSGCTNDEPCIEPLPSTAHIDRLNDLLSSNRFKQTIEDVDDIEFLREADDLLLALREVVQRRIKLVLWGEDIPGTVHFNKIVKNKIRKDGTTASYAYLKASTRDSTRLVKSLPLSDNPDEISEHSENQQDDSSKARDVNKYRLAGS